MSRDFIEAIEQACSTRSANLLGIFTCEEYEAAVQHVASLIRAAHVLLMADHHAVCLFLAITTFEETAKIRTANHRTRYSNAPLTKRGKDPLFSHSKKHLIAFDPVLLIGDRLANSIGESRIKQIFSSSSSLFELRESCLYFSRDNSGMKVPSTEISKATAIEHLLIAVEMHVDAFWGMTDNCTEICKSLDLLYPELERILKSEQGADSSPH